MNTTDGAFRSNTSMRRFSDSSNTARLDATADRGLPPPDDEEVDTRVESTAAAELNNIRRRLVVAFVDFDIEPSFFDGRPIFDC
jgi:hypothetical protein